MFRTMVVSRSVNVIPDTSISLPAESLTIAHTTPLSPTATCCDAGTASRLAA